MALLFVPEALRRRDKSSRRQGHITAVLYSRTVVFKICFMLLTWWHTMQKIVTSVLASFRFVYFSSGMLVNFVIGFLFRKCLDLNDWINGVAVQMKCVKLYVSWMGASTSRGWRPGKRQRVNTNPPGFSSSSGCADSCCACFGRSAGWDLEFYVHGIDFLPGTCI